MSSVDCAIVASILAGEREEDLDEATATSFEAHLDACPRCRDALAGAEEGLAPLAARLEPPDLPDAAWARVDAAVRAEAASGAYAPARGPRLLRPLTAAAAVLLAVTLGFLAPLDLFDPRGAVSSLQPAGAQPPPPQPGPDAPTPADPAGPEEAADPGPQAPTSPTPVAGNVEVLRIEFDADQFVAGWEAIDHLVCVWVREKQ